MSDNILKCQLRDTNLEKNRTIEIIQGVVFGVGISSIPVSFKYSDYCKMLKNNGKIFDLEVEGKKYIVTVKEVQKDIKRNKARHISFHKLDMNKKTTVQVPLRMVGDTLNHKDGGVFLMINETLSIEAVPGKIPEHIDVDVTGIEINDNINASVIKLPKDVRLVLPEGTTPEEHLLVVCKSPTKIEEPTEDKETSDSETSSDEDATVDKNITAEAS